MAVARNAEFVPTGRATANMQVHELNPSVFCRWMSGNGRFGRMGVQGDGSCFFHSVCALTNRDGYLFHTPKRQQEIAYEFRCQFSKRFTKAEYESLSSKSRSPKDFEDEHDGFCSPEVWADEVMIRFASKALNLNLIFLDLDNGRAYCGVHGEATVAGMQSGDMASVAQPTGIVAWVDHRHFEPIVRIDDAERGLITTLFEPAKSERDAQLVQRIMDTYASACALPPSPQRRRKARRPAP